MNIVGIVAEYNPFHAGHRWHIAQTRRRLGECAVVAVMSGNFVQRGDCAIEDKWARTRSALEGGADLVLELPTVWACASAEWFAWGAMSILRAAGAQAISFGSESGDNAALAALSLCLDSGRFQAELRRFLEQGLPFAACRQAAADALLGQDVAACLTRPNDNLAVEYLKAARRAVTLEEVYAQTKTKRYAHARIRRLVLWAALGLRETDRPPSPPYLRVLGANDRGRAALKAIDTDLPIITKPAHGRGIALMELEARCTDFYGLCRRHICPCGWEWTHSPVIL